MNHFATYLIARSAEDCDIAKTANFPPPATYICLNEARMNKYVLRRLFHAPVFTVVILITLAIGIGANTAIFSVINGVLLKPLPYPQPERLAGVWHSARRLNLKQVEICPSMYFTYREHGHAFESIGAYTGGSVSITNIAEPEQVKSLLVTQEVLPILGVQPALGRLFTRQDDTDGNRRTAILTYGYWQKRFGGAPSVIGRRIVVDGEERDIIGVLSPSFRFTNPQPALVTPLQFSRNKAVLGNFSYQGIARLKPGVSLAQANADVARMIPIWLKIFPPPPGFSAKLFEDAGIGPNVRPLITDVVGDIGVVLWVVMGTVGVVLLIACANVANLLLVRTEARQHELAIRAALGAGRARIARELLLESVGLGVTGGALGLAVAFAALRLLVAIAPPGLPRLDDISIDPWALLFAIVISLSAGVLFGILPVFKYSGTRPGTGLRDSSRSVSAGRERHRARNLLVVVQVALALVLLISSGLMIRTFQALRRVQPGFTRPEEVLTLRVSIPAAQVKEPERAAHLDNDILRKIAEVPGVNAAGMTSAITMDGHTGDVLFVSDHPIAEGKIPPVRRFKFIGPGFFHTVGRPFLAGRDLSWTDIYGFRPVVIISENLAREYWRDPSAAIGKRVREGMKDEWREVIGVVANEYDDGVQTKPPTVVYWPPLMKNFWGDETFLWRTMTFVIRSKRTGSVGFLNDLRQAVWSVSRSSPLAEVRTLQEIYGESMARTSFTLVLLAIAAVMALALGLIGIYGVISYSVSQRRREIGIRMALGARHQQVSRMFVRHGLRLAALGIVFGLAASVGLTRLIASMLFNVSTVDPATYLTVSLGLIGAAVLATYIPARRAMSVDPVEALRSE
jgi:putative ABC transport system permease protein